MRDHRTLCQRTAFRNLGCLQKSGAAGKECKGEESLKGRLGVGGGGRIRGRGDAMSKVMADHEIESEVGLPCLHEPSSLSIS